MYYGHNGDQIQNTPQTKQLPQQKKEIRTTKADLFEIGHYYYLRLSIPGVRKENLKVTLNDQETLEIKGKVVTNLPENTKKIIFQEIYQGPFHRIIKLPKKVDKQSVQFTYNNGILEVYINKR